MQLGCATKTQSSHKLTTFFRRLGSSAETTTPPRGVYNNITTIHLHPTIYVPPFSMTENSTVDKPTVWYRHRVFGYALTARILLALRWVPPSWRNYLYDNQALASLVANPWWTFAYVHEELVDWQWKAQDAGQTGTAQLLALVRQVGAATTPPVYFLSILGLMVVDLAIAHYLARLFRWALQESNKDKDLMRDMPQAIQPEYKFPFATATLQTVAPLVYFANPFVILSTAVFGCFSNIKLLCLVIAMDQSATWIAPVALAIAMFLDVSFGVFAIALTSAWEQLAVSFATLHGLSYLVTGIIKVRGSPGTPPPPSLSVLWYTYMEFFSRFAPYLRILFGYLPYIVFVPLAIRLYRYPMALVSMVDVNLLCF